MNKVKEFILVVKCDIPNFADEYSLQVLKIHGHFDSGFFTNAVFLFLLLEIYPKKQNQVKEKTTKNVLRDLYQFISILLVSQIIDAVLFCKFSS